MVLLVRYISACASRTLLNDLVRSLFRLLEGRPRGAKALISSHPLILCFDDNGSRIEQFLSSVNKHPPKQQISYGFRTYRIYVSTPSYRQ